MFADAAILDAACVWLQEEEGACDMECFSLGAVAQRGRISNHLYSGRAHERS
jgi:hypothetical protein